MLRLMLLRHAKSDRMPGVDDHERPLAPRGRRDSEVMGLYMVREGLLPDLAIVSTARRAQETFDLVRSAFAADIAKKDDRRIYEGSTPTILEVIGESPPEVQTLLLVGHNPRIHELPLALVGTARQSDLARLQEKYPTAGLAVLDFDIERWPEVTMRLGQLDRFATLKSIGASIGAVASKN
jgi:phosphohistidine phosphatase